LPHKIQSVFALKPDANYKAHLEDTRSRVSWLWFVVLVTTIRISLP